MGLIIFSDLKVRFIEALSKGDSTGASYVTDLAVRAGASLSRIYQEVLMPALVEVGERWHLGTMTVADEHLATEITLNEMAKLRAYFTAKNRIGLHAVITTVQGEQHSVGARAVADMLIMEGWDVDFLGANTPTSEIASFVRKCKPDLLGISITQKEYVGKIREICDAVNLLRQEPEYSKLKIVVGGAAMTALNPSPAEFHADAVVTEENKAIHVIRKLFNRSAQDYFRVYLRDLGNRISALRKQRGLSQSELSKLADLDRAYISAVECGKQNVSLNAVFKVAQALDVPLERMLTGAN